MNLFKNEKLALINEQLISLIPDDFKSKEMLKDWLNTNPYSPYITLYGGKNALNFDDSKSFISPTDNKERFLLQDEFSFKFENFINFDNKILSANTHLSNIINTKELFKNYPEFAEIEVNINISNANNGYFSGNTLYSNNKANKINVFASNNIEAMRVLLHELQHCIQLKEGFKIGASYYNEHGVMDLFVGINKFQSIDEVKNILSKDTMFNDEVLFKEVFENPEYFNENKDGLKVKLIQIDPYDYIEAVNKVKPNHKHSEDKLQSLKNAYDNGIKVSVPYLIYGLRDEASSDFGQEGYNRAVHATYIGRKTIPVFVRYRDNDENIPEVIKNAINFEKSSFSDISTKKSMVEIDNSKATINMDILKPSSRIDKLRKQTLVEENGKSIYKYIIPEEDKKEYEYLMDILSCAKTRVLGDVLKHDTLYVKYPALYGFKVNVLNIDSQAAYGKNEITLSSNLIDKGNIEEIKSSLLHEVQHAIQTIEGWARGGSPREFENQKEIKELYKQQFEEFKKEISYTDWENNLMLNDFDKYCHLLDLGSNNLSLLPFYNEFIKEKEFDKDKSNYFLYKMNDFDKKINEIKNTESPNHSYLRLWGEQQARATQYRLSMSESERNKEDWTKTLERVEGKYSRPIIREDENKEMLNFVGSNGSEINSFSDIATRKTMIELDSSKAKARKYRCTIKEAINEIRFNFSTGVFDIDDRNKFFAELLDIENISFKDLLERNNNLANNIKDILKNKPINKELLKNLTYQKAIYEKILKTMENFKSTTLENFIEYDELFNKYPQLKDLRVVINKNLESKGVYKNSAIFQGEIIEMREFSLDTLLHEVQHAIQHIEGWAIGGSPQEFKRIQDELSDFMKSKSRVLKENGFDKWFEDNLDNFTTEMTPKDIQDMFIISLPLENQKKVSRILRTFNENISYYSKMLGRDYETSEGKYLRLWGEQQARATQYRKDMPLNERLKEDWTKTLEKVEGSYENPILKYDRVGIVGNAILSNDNEILLYHGTNAIFDKFEKMGDRLTSIGTGHYFTPNIDIAKQYGKHIKTIKVNVNDILDLDNPTSSQKESIIKLLDEVVPSNIKAGYGEIKKIDITNMSDKEAIALYKQKKEETKNLWHDRAKAQIIEDFETKKAYIQWQEEGLQNASISNLKNLIQEYRQTIPKELGYSIAKSGNEVAIYDTDLVNRSLIENNSTKDFNKWFNNSKVVDKDGKPLVVYHGTSSVFDNFKQDENGLSFFTTDPNVASDFGMTIYPCYVSASNIFDPRLKEHQEIILKYFKSFNQKELLQLIESHIVKNIDDVCSSKLFEHKFNVKLDNFSKLNNSDKLDIICKLSSIDRYNENDEVDLGQDYIIPNAYLYIYDNKFDAFGESLQNEAGWQILEYKDYKIIEYIKNQGFDGIKTYERILDTNDYNIAVFSSNQIKPIFDTNDSLNYSVELNNDISMVDLKDFKERIKGKEKEIEKLIDIYASARKKQPKVTYRGIKDQNNIINNDSGSSSEGFGLYTTLNKSLAKDYGKVLTLDGESHIPSNPLAFRDYNSYEFFISQLMYNVAGYKRKSDFGNINNNEILNIINPTLDGIQIGTGTKTFWVKFPDINEVREKQKYRVLEDNQDKNSQREENFNKWFNDSKVVDDFGKPLVVYHGTKGDFSEFSKDRIGTSVKTDNVGFFFTSDYDLAERYASLDYKENGSIMPVYIKAKNPLIIKSNIVGVSDFNINKDKYIRKAKRLLHDSIIVKDKFNDTLVIAFEPTQIKSIHNIGTFNENSPNILEKNDLGLRHIEMMLSIIPDKTDINLVKDYLFFNGVTHENLKGTIYKNALDNLVFDLNNIQLSNNTNISTNSRYFESAGEVESRIIEDLYIKQDLLRN